MLKDLEQRNVSADGMKPLAGDVRTVKSAQTGTNWLRISLIVAMGLVLASMAWWKFMAPDSLPSVHPAAPAAKDKLPDVRAQAAVPAEVVPAVAEVAGAEASAQRLPGLDTELRTVPLVPAEKKTKSAPDSVTELAAIPGGAARPTAEAKSRDMSANKPSVAAAGSSLKSVNPQQKSENLYRQAVSMLQQGRVAEARVVLTQCLEESPLNHNARQLLVGLLVENKHNDEAAILLQEGVRLAPEQTGFVMALARLQVENGDRKTALQTMEQGAKYAADDADYQGFFAALLQRDERHEEAVSRYLAALHSDPANTSWLIGVGISLQEQKKYADAREAFERAKQLGQLSPELADFVDQRLRQMQGK